MARSRPLTLVMAAVAAGLIAAPLGAGSASGATPTPPDRAAMSAAAVAGAIPPGARHRVTLITGDRVTVTENADGTSSVLVDPATAGAGAHTATIGGDVFVLPDQAMPYLAADRIDRDLFNVSLLIEDGYDDATTRRLPLIVQYQKAARDPGSAAVPGGAARTAVLRSIDGAALSTAKAQATRFWRSLTAPRPQARAAFTGGIAKVWLDGKAQADLADSVGQIGAPAAWAAGYDGTGTTVAVLDTGVDPGHPDLAGQITLSQSFVPDQGIDDLNGHGTHTASTVAGTGAASSGVEKGVAPGADLVIGKVLANDGFGQDSWIIDGMEWAANHADIVSMSLGTNEASDGTTPMDEAVNSLTASTGALFVIAAGNNGMVGGIGAPGAADDALTVGADDDAGQLAYFSNRGPRLGDSALKPDLVAPGVDILAARSQLVDGTGYYESLSGTSMATPHVAGAAAIMAQEHPGWSAAQLKAALMTTATPLDGLSPYDAGTGEVDVEAAVDSDIHAEGSVSLGFLRWPNADAAPTQRTITYRNDGDEAVTLDLDASWSDAQGTPAPASLLTLETDQVTVPAGGAAGVTLTADPSAVPAGSRFSGTVVASLAGDPVARTSIALDKESERYDVTFEASGRDGQPAQTYVVLHEVNDAMLDVIAVDGTTTRRLPAGTYSAMTFMPVTDAPDEEGVALLGTPQLVVDQDRVVALDASTASPVTATAPNGEEAWAAFRQLEYATSEGVGFSEAYALPDLLDTMYANPTDTVEGADFEFTPRWRLRTPLLSLKSGGHTYDVLQQVNSGWVDGTSGHSLAYAGTGTADEYAGVDAEDAIVVVQRADGVTVYDAAKQATLHGAAALIVVNNAPGEFLDGIFGPHAARFALPTGGVSGTEGAALIARAQQGHAAIIGGGMNSPWMYELVDPRQGGIPADLAYAPAKDELARVRTRFNSDTSDVGGEFMWAWRPHYQTSNGVLQYVALPSTRVEWVSTQPGTTWLQGVINLRWWWDVRGDKVRYRAGERASTEWFSPVVYPRLGPGYWGPLRQGDYLQVNLPMWGDAGAQHTGSMDSAKTDQVIKLYRGDRLLATSKGWQSLGAQVAPRRAQYRVTATASRNPRIWDTSTSVRSEYTFWTKRITNPGLDHDPLLPFVQVGFDVDTDTAGDARAGARDEIGLTAWQLPEVSLGGEVEGASLQVSYDDGKSWDAVALRGRTGSWHATLRYPDNPARYVSLRATAWDSKGNRATQTVIRAYGLR